MAEEEERKDKPRRALYPAIVLASAMGAHLVSLKAGWVLDDWELFVENPYLRSAAGLKVLLTRELFVAIAEPRLVPYYRPVSGLMYWLTFQLFGTNGLLQHLLNAVLHAGCALLVFALVARLTGRRRGALLAGTLVAAHPITVELVAYMGGRQDIVGWSMTFGAVILLLRARGLAKTAAIAFVATFLAALTREFFLSAPLLHVIAAASAKDAPSRKKSAIAAGAGGLAAAIAVLLLRRVLLIAPFDIRRSVSIGDALGNFAAVFWRLVKDILFPSDVVIELTIEPFRAPAAVALLLGCTIAFVLAVLRIRRRAPAMLTPFLLGCGALASLALLHTSVALRFGGIADRYAYGALPAIVLVLTPVLDFVAERVHARGPRLLGALVAGILVACVPFTWARAADFASDETLQLAMVRERPDDPQAILATIARLRGEGRKEEAYPLCAEYSAKNPRSLSAHACIAEDALAKKDYARAAKYLEPWVYSRPGDAAARAGYFEALFQTRDYARIETALAYFEPVEPNAPDIRAARIAYERARKTSP
jgi:hypothetical protein